MRIRENKKLAVYTFISGICIFINFLQYFFSGAFDLSSGSKKSVIVVSMLISIATAWGVSIYLWLKNEGIGNLDRIKSMFGGIWGVITILLSGLTFGLCVHYSMIYLSISIIILWIGLSSFLFMTWLMLSSSEKDKDLFIRVYAFDILVLVIFQIQTILFPLEKFWLYIAFSLFFYSVLEWMLTQRHLIQSIFFALNKETARIWDALFILIFPTLLAFFLSLLWHDSFKYLLPVMWIVCVLYACLYGVIIEMQSYFQKCSKENKPVISKYWTISLVIILSIYGFAFSSLGFYPPSNPLFEGNEITKGLWFTVKVNKSEVFPYGYARLEDGIFDDIGKPVIAAVGQMFGMVQKCRIPGPDVSYVMRSPDPRSPIQPRYMYSIHSMCIEWQNTLPTFFWRIGLIGLLFLSLVLGIFVFKSPMDFALISLILFGGWCILPESLDIRMGDIAVLVAGMGFLLIVIPLLRKNDHAWLVLWGITSGVLFGIAGLVRSPSGMALFLTSLLIIAVIGLLEKRIFIALITAAALLVGYNIEKSGLNGVFLYRDNKLQITAPSISPRGHGTGFALLGGLGGDFYGYPSSYEYENSMDMGFKDTIIFFNIFNENPMVTFTQDTLENTLRTGERLFVNYFSKHPIEFFVIIVKKSIETLREILKFPINWFFISGILICAFLIRIFGEMKYRKQIQKISWKSFESILVLTVLCIISSGPVILTTPHYSQATYPTATVFLFTMMVAVYLLFKQITQNIGDPSDD